MSNPILGAIGNDYCGPYISDGQFQPSVEGKATARSALQQACKEHDAAYARRENYSIADQAFIKTVNHLGGDVSFIQKVLGRLFGTAVSLNDVYRYLNGTNLKSLGVIGDRSNQFSMVYDKKRKVGFGGKTGTYSEKLITQPSTYGTGLVLQPIVVNRHGTGIKVRGSEFTNPSVSGSTAHATLWKCINLINLNPAYFENSRLGNYCKLYAKFKFTKLRLNYITNVGTSTAGSLLVEYMPSTTEVHRNFNATTFLNQVMGNPGSCLMPMWENFKIDIPVDVNSDLKFITSETTAAIREVHDGNIVVYANSVANGVNTGYYVLEYECIFDQPNLSVRINDIPYPAAWSWRYFGLYNLTDSPVADAKVFLSGKNGLGVDFLQGGYVYKIVFDVTSAVKSGAGTGTASTTLFNNFKVPGTQATTNNTLPACVDGFTCYGVTAVAENYMHLYSTLTGALLDTSDGLYYRNTITGTVIDFNVWAIIIRDNNYQNQADA